MQNGILFFQFLKYLQKKRYSTSFKGPVLIQRFYSVIVQRSPTSCLWGRVNRGEIAELPLQLLYAAAATKALSRRRYLSNCRRHITGFLAARRCHSCIMHHLVCTKQRWVGGSVAGIHPPTGERQDFEAPQRVVNSSGVSRAQALFWTRAKKKKKKIHKRWQRRSTCAEINSQAQGWGGGVASEHRFISDTSVVAFDR